jgi:hypothetical protein
MLKYKSKKYKIYKNNYSILPNNYKYRHLRLIKLTSINQIIQYSLIKYKIISKIVKNIYSQTKKLLIIHNKKKETQLN